MPPIPEDEHRRLLDVAYKRADLTLQELWVRYFGLGGDADLVEVEAYLHGLLSFAPLQRDMLAHAVNERFDEFKVPYTGAAEPEGETNSAV